MILAIKKHKRQVFLFLIAGAVSACIEIFSLLIFEKFLPVYFSFENLKNGYPLSSILATGAGILSNYILSIRYVFKRGKHSKRKEFSLFLILSIGTVIMTWALFTFFLSISTHLFSDIVFKHSKLNIIFSRAAAISIVSVLNYWLKKKLVFTS
ncbi:GtrA family protein [Apibacter raozihei]|uniref:GtrA family protein n=1 Tax=Apibacter raozihei TaxID=2500547 RepID=UPI000FE33B61|nr:GtrA family protein [Apibacter raozihei]